MILLLLGGTIWALRYRPWLGFLGAWFFLILAPTSSFLPIVHEVAAERRMYLPLAAIVTLVVLGLHRLLQDAVPDSAQGALSRRNIAIGFVAALAITLGVLTVQRNEDYRTLLSIWTDTVTKRPANARAHLHLADTLAGQDRVDDAIAHYQEALRLAPDYNTVHIALGVALGRRGRLDEAIEQFSRAIAVRQELTTAYFNRGVALARKGRTERAVEDLKMALQYDPDSQLARQALTQVQAHMASGGSDTQALHRTANGGDGNR